MIIKFKDVLAGEILKSKRTFGYFISLLLPVAATVVAAFIFFRIGFFYAGKGVNTWELYGTVFLTFYTFAFPLYIFIVTSLLIHIEGNSAGFKFLFTLPMPREYLYLSKVVLTLYWLSVSFILAYALFMVVGNTFSVLYPDMRLQEYNVNKISTLFFLQLYIGCVGLLAIQAVLSIRFNNLIKPVGFGILLFIVGIFSFKLEYAYLFPYCYPMVILQDFRMNYPTIRVVGVISQLFYAITFFVIGFFAIRGKLLTSS